MKALIVWGGWDGHTPEKTANTLAGELTKHGVEVRLEKTLDAFLDVAALKALDLIVPVWTMGPLSGEQWKGLNEAVRSGVGVGGVHGGMGDAFRGSLEYQWMVGGQFVGHPHVGDYVVRLTAKKSPITKGMKKVFPYKSEQYYMLIDPGIEILAETTYAYDGSERVVPVVWTKTWGEGRVFYSALGHVAQEFVDYPDVLAMTTRGLLWAAEGKAKAGK